MMLQSFSCGVIVGFLNFFVLGLSGGDDCGVVNVRKEGEGAYRGEVGVGGGAERGKRGVTSSENRNEREEVQVQTQPQTQI